LEKKINANLPLGVKRGEPLLPSESLMRYGLAQNAIRLHSHLDSISGNRYNGGGCVVSNAKSKLINIYGI